MIEMFPICNGILGLFNLVTLIVSIPTITAAWYLETHGKSSCDCYVRVTLLTMGLFLLGMSLLGLFGSWCELTIILWLYLWSMLFLIVGVVIWTVSGLSVVHNGEREGAYQLTRAHNNPVHEYRIEDFSDWLQSNVLDNEYWVPFKSCLIETQACNNRHVLLASHVDSQHYMKKNPIQWGCCKPPTQCGFEQKNETFWTVPKSGLASKDNECMRWSNHPETLCYDCNTCKAGFLALLKNDLHKILYFNSCLVVFLLINFFVACYAFRSNRDADRYSRYRNEMIRKACQTHPIV